MTQQEITIGLATYAVSRMHIGSLPPAQLLAERIANQLAKDPPFDGHPRKAV